MYVCLLYIAAVLTSKICLVFYPISFLQCVYTMLNYFSHIKVMTGRVIVKNVFQTLIVYQLIHMFNQLIDFPF